MILSDRTLREQLALGRIVVEPFDERCVQPSSIDVKLSNHFRVFRNHTAGVIDVKSAVDLTEPVEIADDGVFMLHPGEFVLGSTLERIAVPDDMVSRIDGKSSLGRLGLIIHSTAGFIDPGFDGHITLELTNIAHAADHAVPVDEGRPGELHDDDHPGRSAVRPGRHRLEVPGPARADPQPVLRELHTGSAAPRAPCRMTVWTIVR